jgi:hypothetical protein
MKVYGGSGRTDRSILYLGTSFKSRPTDSWEKAPRTYWLGGWVVPRVNLEDGKRKILRLLGHKLQPLCRRARSQTLYRLSYPGSKSRGRESEMRRRAGLGGGRHTMPTAWYQPSLWQLFRASALSLTCIELVFARIVVKALCYKPEGRGFEKLRGKFFFFNLPNPSGRTRSCGLLSL